MHCIVMMEPVMALTAPLVILLPKTCNPGLAMWQWEVGLCGRIHQEAVIQSVGNSAMGMTGTSGSSNTAVGSNALLVTNADGNTAVGRNAGNTNTTGTNNTLIGL